LVGGANTSSGNKIFSPPERQNWLWRPHNFLLNDSRGSFAGLKMLERKFGHSPPSSAEVKKKWSYNLIFSVAQQPKSALGHHSVEVSRSHTPGRTLLNRRTALHRGHYPHNTQQTQETSTHALSGIRIRDPSNRVALDLRLRLNYTSTPPICLHDVQRENFTFFGYDSV